MTAENLDLASFGWNAFFESQRQLDDQADAVPVRVMSVHRAGLSVAAPGIDLLIPTIKASPGNEAAAATVGDWLLLDRETSAPRLMQRKSLFSRRAAGAARKLQLIAANVDTLFVVSSCNEDFNVARLERYLALAREADVTPVIVLTKADLTDEPEEFVRAAAALMPGLMVEIVDARDPKSVAGLAAWCGLGQTVALVGSSGVGKSTLVNTLTGIDQAATQSVREEDGKGRHTTSARSLHRLPTKGWIVDTPGMRELQLTDITTGIDEVFADVVALIKECKFTDCRHEAEPGCAVLAAIAAGTFDSARLTRWQKLVAEEAHNTANLAERHAHDRTFTKKIKVAVKSKRRPRGR
ncbi:MAG: ribosome small subunit-dependent GTPase A [Proteobacteria bacterium]|nr:ribosome small subunit-dependent GTPase A [Pseudomonadota bacterium]MDA1058687.1 ribosome small subunit-dependent GTPase A [Pseudomonadota bacterium]